MAGWGLVQAARHAARPLVDPGVASVHAEAAARRRDPLAPMIMAVALAVRGAPLETVVRAARREPLEAA